jgi:hypothetical protein
MGMDMDYHVPSTFLRASTTLRFIEEPTFTVPERRSLTQRVMGYREGVRRERLT